MPQTLRAHVAHWFDRLREAGEDIPDGDHPWVTNLVRLVASSEFAAAVLLREWHWFTGALADGELDKAPDHSSLASPDSLPGAPLNSINTVKAQLRQHRNRSLVHILWRASTSKDTVWDTLTALSDLADVLVETSIHCAEDALIDRFGKPIGKDGRPVNLIVLAMGKLGGGELNFSSDIDLIFLYTGEGETDGPRSMSAHEYFTRLSRQIVSLLDESTQDGFVYRVDTRLRPFGDSGPPVVSLAALENYLLQHGRNWERYAYIKARAIAPTATAEALSELRKDIIEPFVYRRYLDYGVFESLREMKALIEAEVRKRDLADNVKLGPGGIREIEFIAQSLQLVRGGADQQLRRQSLHEALSRLVIDRALGEESVSVLLSAYEFLRRFENGLQAIRDQQTHDIPEDSADRARLALVMGYDEWGALFDDLNMHRDNVSRQFLEVAFRADERPRPAAVPDPIHRTILTSEDELAKELNDRGYVNASAIARCVSQFLSSPSQRQVDATSRKRLDRFMRSFIDLLQSRQNAGVVCERVFAILSKIVRRSAYIALLNENPLALERLADLCEQSAYLTEEISRFPLLLDELLDPRLYTAQISASIMREDLGIRLRRVDADDSEGVIEALAQYQRATLFKIAVADISGKLPIMRVSDCLTDLAEIVLNKALELAWADLVAKHGVPKYESDGEICRAGFGVIAYGKLGGIELSYRSDLDLVFLHDSHGSSQQTDGERPLDNSMFFGRLVRRLVHFLTAQTSSGVLYEVDTRLRPSGRSGLLVVSVDGFAKYQMDNAWTWEHQALLRSRPVAGDERVNSAFERIRSETLRSRVHRAALLEDVLSMRKKMREQLDKSKGGRFDLKQGEGGIGDIEFLVQYLVLKNAEAEPSLIRYSDNIRQLDALASAGVFGAVDAVALQDAYKVFRLCTHRLALDDKPPLVDFADFGDERKLVKSIWEREMR